MKIKKLRRTHADFDLGVLERNRDLFQGGERFRKNVSRYLPMNENEPRAVYGRRCALAADEYLNYCGPIGNYFASWLFTSQLTYKTEPEQVDEFYNQFHEDIDGDGCEFSHFLHERFIDSAQDGAAYWRVEFPEGPPEGAEVNVLAEWKAAGLGRATLVPMPASSITNWKLNDDGDFEWLIEYTAQTSLLDPGDEDETTVETWTIWRQDENHQRFEIRYAKGKKPRDEQEAPEVDMPKTQGLIRGIPIVTLQPPPEMHIMNLISAPQLANFRKRAGLSWAIDRNCYAMPVFGVKNKKKPPVMGTGYYLMLAVEETLTYAAPPAAPFGVIREFVTELKDEIHRIAQQMARGVENNAASIGRSGASKQADDLATEIVLAGYGKHIRKAAKKTLDLISAGRGENIEHTVGGMETYHVTDADSFSKMALASQGMNIPSPTHHRLVAKRQSTLMLPDADEKARQQINKEIDAGITDETIALQQNASMGLLPQMTEPEDKGAEPEKKKPAEDAEAA
jgi:hypothetical protein